MVLVKNSSRFLYSVKLDFSKDLYFEMTLEDLSAADNGTVVTFSLKCPGGSVTEMFSSELIVAGSVVQRLFPILNVSVSLRL